MPILTSQEARDLLDYAAEEEMPAKVTSILLPAIDQFIEDATGKDWGTITETYTDIDPTAKMAAGVLLVRWFDNPGQIGTSNDIGVTSLIGQLNAKALQEAQAAEEAAE